ncbi:MAG: type II toxin-antitoxin system RelE/ParE family toxin [Bacteroidetes bacterium]|jgi:toxin ParE1/3/4|nr:type II toxin-antitoxin system RelE/ParE family toxin [Bacteroidota bacterium]MBT6685107.1 type II toxin-antitoxin system RelE/ParE family toxin [Bacteroidota bacterium]MBT7141928.1 type II toxin-antitoxin system RelE/ParE family toxin [Bacteroidota bacterium]MBT7491187.1 type II toxin-antitoxin system RelE/ParE family toxin [Bacteroidota bacterium]
MNIKISPFAEQDLERSIKWYNSEKDELGNEFAKEISHIFERIRTNSLQFPKEYRKMQKAKTKKFPFNVFFVVKEKSVYILGIFHSSRNPNIMKSQYKNTK